MAAAERKSVTLTREELYDLVWSTPMRTIAQRYGLSDQGLAKKCKKHGIPRPPVGYWAKVAHGKKVSKPPLPALSEPSLRTIELREGAVAREGDSPAFVVDPQDPRLAKARSFVVPSTFRRYHSLVSESRKAFSTRIVDQYGFLISDHRMGSGLGLKVTAASVDRAHKLMETLIRLFEGYGWSVVLAEGKYDRHRPIVVTVDGENLEFRVKEKVSQVDHVKTREEQARNYSYEPKYDYLPTGVLTLEVTNARGAPKSKWHDKEGRPLEKQLVEVVKGLISCAEAHKHNRLEREARQREWEAAQRRADQERQKQRNEQARVELLIKAANEYQIANNIRVLLQAVEVAIESGRVGRTEEVMEWIDCAAKTASRLDPVNQIEKIVKSHGEIG